MAKNVSQESIQYVNDFFKVSNAINDYLIKTSPRDSFWGARTCTTIVIINQYDEEKPMICLQSPNLLVQANKLYGIF